jgi:hypothetical protein
VPPEETLSRPPLSNVLLMMPPDRTLSVPPKRTTSRYRSGRRKRHRSHCGREEDGIEQNFPAHFRTRETADLFLSLIIRLLKPGGRAAVVLPDGTLFGEGVKTRLKEHLMAECNLHSIVRLPNVLDRFDGGADGHREPPRSSG